MSLEKTVLKYFNYYTEPDVRICDYLPEDFCGFNHSVVVPLCDELKTFHTLVESLQNACEFSEKNVLLIVVVNSSIDSVKEIQSNNQKLLDHWRIKLEILKTNCDRNTFFYGKKKLVTFLFVDRNSCGVQFREKRGVGLARKIGCDIACFLYWKKKIKSQHIFTTDCDVILPEDFFVLKDNYPKRFFMLSPFKHYVSRDSPRELKKAMQTYDRYLECYVNGLLEAGSPYAFHTIGSLISFSVEAYILVRGFPKNKLAGEDFYFLNKVAKVASYYKHTSKVLLLSSRLSQRVPFGTGQALLKILECIRTGCRYKFYHPQGFLFLKVYLSYARIIFLKRQIFSQKNKYDSLVNLCWEVFKETYDEKNVNDFIMLLEQEGYLSEIIRINSTSLSFERKYKSFCDWFDGFKTLKFIHKITDHIVFLAN